MAHFSGQLWQFPLEAWYLPEPQLLAVETHMFWLRVRPAAQAVQYEAVREHSEQGYWQVLQVEVVPSQYCPEGQALDPTWQTPLMREYPEGQLSTQASEVVYLVGQFL